MFAVLIYYMTCKTTNKTNTKYLYIIFNMFNNVRIDAHFMLNKFRFVQVYACTLTRDSTCLVQLICINFIERNKHVW